MFGGMSLHLGHLLGAIAQAICVAVLAVLSSMTPAASPANATRPAIAQPAAPRAFTFGTLETQTQHNGMSRHMWMARLSLFEVRVERASSQGSASWSVTVQVYPSGQAAEADAEQEKCI